MGQWCDWDIEDEAVGYYTAANEVKPSNCAKCGRTFNELTMCKNYDGDLVWVTKERKSIVIYKLGDEHLVNIIKLIQNRHDSKVLASCNMAGDNGSMEDAILDYDLAGPEFTTSPLYPRLMEEALRRGLKVNRYEKEEAKENRTKDQEASKESQ